MINEQDSDPVGYKRPPINTRFKPGTSGNPQGRPKGVRNFKTELREELGEIISIQDGHRELKISKQRAFIKALVTSALNGDLRATSLLASLCVQIFRTESEDEQGGLAGPEDQEIVEAFVARELKRRPAQIESEVDSNSTSKHKRTKSNE